MLTIRISGLKDEIKERGRQVLSDALKWQPNKTVVKSNECDLVAIFNSSASYDNICWYFNLLQVRVPQLIIRLNYHKQSGQYAMYLTCRGMREFSLEESELFEHLHNPQLFFSSQQRASIIHHFLLSLRAKPGDIFGDKLKFSPEQNITHYLQSAGVIKSIFPLHDMVEMRLLSRSWINSASIISQPIDKVERYFGVRVALYFAWLGHYTKALLVFSIFTLLSYVYFNKKNNFNAHYTLTAVFNILWCMMYLEHWRRTSTDYAYRWGTLDSPPSLLEEPRPNFTGDLAPCPITKRMVPHYPAYKRKLILLIISSPVTLICIIGVIVMTYFLMELQQWTDKWIEDEYQNKRYTWMSYGPKILHAICIMIADAIYKAIAVRLTELENHRLEDTHRNFLIGKLILFQFVNSFYLLFFTAFVTQDMKLLKQQLSTILIVRQFTGNFKEVFLPIGQTRLKQFYLSMRYESLKAAGSVDQDSDNSDIDDPDQKVTNRKSDASPVPFRNRAFSIDGRISQPEQEAILPQYDDSCEDYLEMFIQFGYVSMFSCAFPFASVLAFLNNVLEIRADAYKLTTAYKRPIAMPASGIGVWQTALEIVSYIAVATNIGLLYVSGTLDRYLPSVSDTNQILLLVFFEHIVFAIRYMIGQLIPDTPAFIENEVAILEHKRREALKTLERESMKQYQKTRSKSHDQHEEVKASGDI
ncbi:hypothetical protein Ciccas_002387 [Cichlidogyrus casuarinus]|uniref:Anoctamin n=1 Tax=Cichlidogyrus casuarinus TaxID=1844966 RepID=A0ABD2QHE5_9PLAT